MNTIAQIRTFPTKTNAEGLAGRITKVGQFYSGDGAHGPWSFQDIELQDATGKIVVCLDKRPELAQDWNGANVSFIPGEHQGRPCGIIAEDHQPKARQGQQPPQAYRRVRITPSATMNDEGNGTAPAPQQRTAYDSAQEAQGRPAPQSRHQSAPAPQQRQNTQQAPQRQQTQPQRPPSPQQQPAAGSTNEARRMLAKITTLYGLCYDAAVSQAFQIYERHGYAIMPGAVGIMADKLLMETIRRVSVEDLPLSNAAPLKGRPLSELMPFLEEALDQNLARRTQVEQTARETTTRQVPQPERPPEPRRPAPAPAQAQRQPEPEPERQTGSDEDAPPAWREGMEEDDIPF